MIQNKQQQCENRLFLQSNVIFSEYDVLIVCPYCHSIRACVRIYVYHLTFTPSLYVYIVCQYLIKTAVLSLCKPSFVSG